MPGGQPLYLNDDDQNINMEHKNMLPTIEVEHLIRTGSDHAPLLMTCGVQTTNFVKPFIFLNFWTKHATFMDVVRQNWEADFIGDPFFIFKQNIKRVTASLSKWSREIFGDIFKQLAILEDIKYLSIEEQYWKQKAGMTCFTGGDRNTSFLHNHINGKRKKLQLKRIKSGSRVWIKDQEQLATAANLELSRLLTIKEVRAAVFKLSGESASGPDGFTGLFYQTCWDVIGADIHNMVLHFYGGVALPKSITHTNLVFVKGRSIFENILLTQEIVTDIKLRGNPANVMIKFDMAKAYDRVSWKHSSGFFKSTRGVKKEDPLSPALFILSAEEVAELRQGEAWDDQLLDQTFIEDIAEHIRLNVHYEGSEGYWDRPYWMPTPSGKFSVSSAWQILMHKADPN
ncbi:uncharacterized protein [Nicotiana tomentosiformis]|uniref:uncharacterized protein n=1 Tax=Nicotiana tomentosiformis TaxID=4098 RepID=UPI00388C4221